MRLHGQMSQWWARPRFAEDHTGAAVHGVSTNASTTEISSLWISWPARALDLVHEIKPAATIVRDLVERACRLIEQRLTASEVVRRHS